MTALIDAAEGDFDRSLVVRHQAGDAAAFAQLYARHYHRLTRFCRRLVRDPHLAEEIAQDAFLRAYVALERLDGDRRFYPWLTVIARRLVIDHVRRDGRVQPHPHVDPGQAGAAEDVVVQRFEGDQVLAALDRVRSRHREIIHLRDWEGLSYEAIAERLDLTPTAVPPLLHRARAAMRREYLLVAEGRVAGFLHLSALVALVRRGRDRLASWAAWLPEVNVISAPVAGAVLGIGALLAVSVNAPVAPVATASARNHGIAVPSGTGTPTIGDASPSHELTAAQRPDPDGPEIPQPGPRQHVVVPKVAELTVNDSAAVQRARDRQRDQPIFFEFGPAYIASDPEEDRRHFEQVVSETIN